MEKLKTDNHVMHIVRKSDWLNSPAPQCLICNEHLNDLDNPLHRHVSIAPDFNTVEYEIDILKADIELYEQLRQEFIAEEKTLPVEGRTRRFEGLERISGLKTRARQRLAELNFTKLTGGKP